MEKGLAQLVFVNFISSLQGNHPTVHVVVSSLDNADQGAKRMGVSH